jgi:hypothetical protein
VQLRRGLIAFALVLAAVTVAASLSSSGTGGGITRPAAAPRASGQPLVSAVFHHPPGKVVPVRSARVGSHVIVQVDAVAAGSAEIPGLGLVEPVAADAPAVFDLLAERPGRFDVTVAPAAVGERTRVGTIVVASRP